MKRTISKSTFRSMTLCMLTLGCAVVLTANATIAAAPFAQQSSPETAEPEQDAPPKPKDEEDQDGQEKQSKAKSEKQKSQLSPRRRRPRRGRDVEQLSKRADNFVSLFQPVVEPASKSVVQIYSGGRQLALGLIVDSDGLIITKASELKGEIKCRLPNGKLLPADVYGIHSSTDLAMLQVKAVGLKPVNFAAEATPEIGQWIATPLPDQKTLVGIVSVNTREIPASTPFIGISMGDLEDRDGVRISFVVSKSPADEAGLWINDVIIKIDSIETADMKSLKDALGQYDPDQRVTLTVMRGDTEKKIKLTLAEKDKVSPLNRRSNQQNSMGSRLSRRRKAFPSAFQHDSMLTAKNCGGPLVNLQGDVIGINIARAGRVASYALPVAAIEPIIAELRTGELAPEIVNKEAIAKIDVELDELVERLGNLPNKRTELERKIELEKVRRAELSEILKDLRERLKKQEADLAAKSRSLKSLKDELKRAESVKNRLNANRKLLSTGRR